MQRWEFLLVGAWVTMVITTSTLLSLTLKALFGVHRFKGVYLTTDVHFGVIAIVACLALYISSQRLLPKGHPFEIMGWMVAAAVFTCGEVMLSNMSYAACSMSVMALLKSFSPVTTYFLGVCFNLEDFDRRLAISLGCFVVGSLLALSRVEVKGAFGMLALIGSMLSNSFRWLTVQVIIRNHNANALQLMACVQSIACCFMMYAVWVREFPNMTWTLYGGNWSNVAGLARHNGHLSRRGPLAEVSALHLVLLSTVLAILLTYAGYRTVRLSSASTLSVILQLKTVLTVGSGAFIFGERFTAGGFLGMLVSLGAFGAYAYVRLSHVESLYDLVDEDTKWGGPRGVEQAEIEESDEEAPPLEDDGAWDGRHMSVVTPVQANRMKFEKEALAAEAALQAAPQHLKKPKARGLLDLERESRAAKDASVTAECNADRSRLKPMPYHAPTRRPCTAAPVPAVTPPPQAIGASSRSVRSPAGASRDADAGDLLS